MADHTMTIRLEAESFGDVQVDVLRLDGREAIGQLFEFDLLVSTVGELDLDAVMDEPMSLVFRKGEEVLRRVHGIAADIEERVSSDDAAQLAYGIRLVPRMWLASTNETLDIFMEMTVPEIIETKMKSWGLTLGESLVHRLRREYPKREFVVQYRESDVDFVCRLSEHLGISLTFEHDDNQDIAVFSDHNEAFVDFDDPPEVRFVDRGAGEGISQLRAKRRTLPQRYIVRDYNYRTPSIDLTATVEVPGGRAGDVVEYGAHFKSKAEGEAIAGLRVEELLATRLVFHGDALDPVMRAGRVVKLEGHPRGDLELLVVEVDHLAEMATPQMGGAPRGYRTHIRAIQKDLTYRPPRLVPKPKVAGVLTGVVDATSKGAYAELDGEGRYRVKFLYDTATKDEGQASRPVRMAQSHAGAGYGMHFPLRPGVEVILTCVDGDPDRPIISSTVPNPSTPSPVTGGNAARNVIRTGGGNEINIDDTDGSHRIKMTTPNSDTTFQLGAPNYSEQGAALATAGAWTSAVGGTTSAISGAKAAVDQISTALTAGDIINHATVVPMDGKWWADTIKALSSAAKGFVGAIDGFAKIEQTSRANDASRTTKEATDAKKSYDEAVRRLPPDQKQAEEEYAKARADLKKVQDDLKKKRADLEALPPALSDEDRARLTELENTMPRTQAEEFELMSLGQRRDQESERARLEAEIATLELRGAEAEDNVMREEYERDQAIPDEATRDALDEERNKSDKAATAQKDADKKKKDYDKAMKEGPWAATKTTMDAIDAAVQGGAPLVSWLMGKIQGVQQAAAITEVLNHYENAATELGKSRKMFIPGVPSKPFNINAADGTAGVIGKVCTIVASNTNLLSYGRNHVATAASKLVLSSGDVAELNGEKELFLSATNQIDAYCKGKVKMVAHDSEQRPKQGKPDMLIASKKDWQAVSTAGAMQLFAKKSILAEAETEPIEITAKAKSLALTAGYDKPKKVDPKDIGLFSNKTIRAEAKEDISAVADKRAGLVGDSKAWVAAGKSSGFGVYATTTKVTAGKLSDSAKEPTVNEPNVTVDGKRVEAKASGSVLTMDSNFNLTTGKVEISGKGTATVKGNKVFIG